jgi:phage-related protein
MPIQLLHAGAKFEIYAWGDEQHCDTLEFLEQLAENSNADANRLLYLIIRTANHGPLNNKQQLRSLGDGIFEFKAPNTSRLLWFYDANRIIICTHGFSGKRGKGKTPQREIDRAKQIRQKYLEEKTNASRK